MSSSGQIFNRQAYVGLAGDFGAVKLGRQYTEGFNFFGDYDPLTIGNYTGNSWMYFSLTQLRRNNVVSYGGSFSGLTSAPATASAKPGQLHEGQRFGRRHEHAVLRRTRPTTTARSASVACTRKSATPTATSSKCGALLVSTVGPAKLFLATSAARPHRPDRQHPEQRRRRHDERQPARTPRGCCQRQSAQGHAGLHRRDLPGHPALALTGVFYGDYVETRTVSPTTTAAATPAALIAEYSLSKRTQVYGAADFNKVSGATTTELPGRNNQTSFGAGIRHIF
jgi:predicted porin